MKRSLFLFMTALSLVLVTQSDSFAGRRRCQSCQSCQPCQTSCVNHCHTCQPACACGAATVTQSAPPQAPGEGTTAQSHSIQPQAEPPAAPTGGVSSQNYSVQPAPAYRYYQPVQSPRIAPFNPEQRRQHPTSNFLF